MKLLNSAIFVLAVFVGKYSALSTYEEQFLDQNEAFPFISEESENFGLWPLFTPLVNVSQSCKYDSIRYITNIFKGEMWAITMLDSTGRLPKSGFLHQQIKKTLCEIAASISLDCSLLGQLGSQTIYIPVGYNYDPGSPKGCLAVDSGIGIRGKHCVNAIIPNEEKLGGQLGAILGSTGGPARSKLQELASHLSRHPAFREYINSGLRAAEDLTSCDSCYKDLDQAVRKLLEERGIKDVTLADVLKNIEVVMLFLWWVMNISEANLGYSFVGYGICIPNSCTYKDVGANMEAVLGLSIFNAAEQVLGVPVNLSDVMCVEAEDDLTWTPLTSVITATFAILIFFLVLGTLLDIYLRHTDYNSHSFDMSKMPLGMQILLAFSLYTNLTAVMRTTPATGSSGGDILTAVNGIRFISMTWVVIGHTFVFLPASMVTDNALSVREMSKGSLGLASRALTNALPSVDSFFVLSGLLVAMGLFRELDRTKGQFRLILFYFHRYVRLTIPLMLLIAFVIAYLPILGDLGQNQVMKWMTRDQSIKCQSHGWSLLLYINIFYNEGKQCIGQTWYLANDMIFFWLSPLIIYPMWSNSKYGIWRPLAWWTTWLVAFTFPLFYLTAKYKFGFVADSIQDTDPEVWTWLPEFYQAPWARIQPYLVGILLAYIFYMTKRLGKEVLNRNINLIGWFVAFWSGIAVIYGIGPATPETTYTVWMPIYNGFQRTVWSLAVSWVIYSCAKGYGGLINDLLSWSFFTPLARISFMTYLVHIYVIFLAGTYFGDFGFEHNWLSVTGFMMGMLMISMAIALVFTLMFESPFIRIEKLLMSKAMGSSDNKKK